MALPHLLILQLAIFAVFLSCKGIFPGAESVTQSLVTDKEALTSFRSHVSMESTNPLSSWDQNSSPCNWTGVICNKSRQRVVGLDLSGLGLMGSISPHIGNLSVLESLQLQGNQFTGTLPDQLGNLFHLRVLNMSSNSIEGAIPPNISHCKELMILDMMQNEISGGIPEELSHLTKLQVLHLGKNHLSGSIPPSIANISSLISLNLGTNTLSGILPGDLARLRNLKQLDLSINNLTGTVPPSIYNMSSLVYLVLASNNLRGNLPSDVGVTLPNLLRFNFCFNKFTGTIPGSLHNLTKIQLIRMAHNLLHGTVPPGLGNLPDLRMYNIGFNYIVSSGVNGLNFLTSLTNSTHLNFLAIDGNLLEGVIPESVGNLSKGLTHLYMGGNRIYGSIPASIGDLSGLALLNMSYNFISGEIPREIGQLEELQVLGLAGNRISGEIHNSFDMLKKLTQIDLSDNELVGSIPTVVENFQKLLLIDLSGNMLNGSIPKQMFNLPSLSTYLNLSKNFLSGPLPQELEILENVITIDLSHNNLSGNIPNSIGKCKSLEKLFMAKNLFSGNIPDTFEAVKGLEILDLSSNKLSGTIPVKLQKLRALQLLNLSYNNLEGEVPGGGVFNNLSRVHLEGNPKLNCHLGWENTRGHGRRLSSIKIIISMAAILAALCFAVSFLFYIRKGKAKVMTTSESFKRQHRIVSYNELRVATDNFNQENLVGHGSFGSVYRGYLREGRGMAIAVKVLDTQRIGSCKSFFAECMVLKNVRHRNLVKLITSCSSIDFKNTEFLSLVYEFMSNGSLEDWIMGKRRKADGEGLNATDRLNVAIDVAYAIKYLHCECEAPIAHCDLKPSNVLLDEGMTAKVGDFGLARFLIERSGDQPSISSTNALKGSIGYIPPEYGMGGRPSTAGDVYSYGIMLLELFTGKKPTNESFIGGLSLKKWVQMSFPASVEQVLDPELLSHADGLSDDGEFTRPETQIDCLITIIGVGLCCTSDSPDERMSMTDVLRKLISVRDTIVQPTPNKSVRY